MGLARKVGWRAGLAWEKLRGEHAHLPWGVAWRCMTLRRPMPRLAAVDVVSRDEAAGMLLLRIGGHDYWYPLEASRENLGAVHAEVFDPTQDHFYESRETRVQPGDVVLDAGSCEGFFVRYALERGARVLAVEPWSAMAACLTRTFAPEIARGEVEIARALLGPTPFEGELTVDLYFPFGARSDGLNVQPEGIEEERPIAGPQVREPVAVTTLDALVASSAFRQIDFVKMDIEGAEAEALAGAGKTLRRCLPRLSITTYHHSRDWRRIAGQIRAFVPCYRFWLKGMVRYDEGGWRPIMLHAWAPDASRRTC